MEICPYRNVKFVIIIINFDAVIFSGGLFTLDLMRI